MSYVLTFIISFLTAMAVVPTMIRMARIRGWYDSVGGRKLHKGKIPRLGGVGIACGFFVAVVIVYFIYNPLGKLRSPGMRFWLLMAVGAGYQILGLVDDFIGLAARLKFVVQIALAIAVVALGYGFSYVEVPFAPYRLTLGVFGPAITVLWIVGVANAVNLIDGMDGLAGGLAFISSATWVVLFYMNAQYLPAIVATAAGGAILGFLFFNFPPANIFMGDSGSLFIGFLLAIVPLLGGVQYQGETGLLPAITICLIPLLDTVSAILRRWRIGVSFFTADRFHVHHKLLNLGFNVRQTLAILYGLDVLLSAAAVSTIYVSMRISFILMVTSWVLVLAFYLALHYLKQNEVKLIARPEESRRFNEEPEE